MSDIIARIKKLESQIEIQKEKINYIESLTKNKVENKISIDDIFRKKRSKPWKKGMSKYIGITNFKGKWILQSRKLNAKVKKFDTLKDCEIYFDNLLKKNKIDCQSLYREGYMEEVDCPTEPEDNS